MSASNLRIGLLLYDLGVGGAERSTLMLASALADVGHRVTLFVYRNRFDLVGELDPRVQLVKGVSPTLLRRYALLGVPLRQLHQWRQVDVLIAACRETLAPAIWTRRIHQRPVISCVRYDMHTAPRPIESVVDRLAQRTYGKVDWLVGVSEGTRRSAVDVTGLAAERTSTIFNASSAQTGSGPSAVEAKVKALREARPGARIGLVLGRLHPVKRIDRALKALAHARGLGHDVQLVVAGEGAERPRLEQLAATLGVADHTHMVGLERNASRAFRSVDFFVSCSESEGFCRTVLEALQQGCAVLSTDCPSGPREVLADGRFGLLCPNSTTGLQAGLVELLERGPVPIDQAALDVHLEQFAPQAIARQWSELFERVLRTCQ